MSAFLFLRRALARSAALSLAGAAAAYARCDASADDAYLRRLLAPAPAPTPESPVSAGSTEPPLDVLAINAAALAERGARLVETEEDDDANASAARASAPAPALHEAAYLLRQTQTGLVRALRLSDVASVDREVALLVVTRGTHPAVAQAALRSVAAAAAADRTGMTFYAVTDETPRAVRDFLRSALHCEAAAGRERTWAEAGAGAGSEAGFDSDSAAPLVAVFDRAGRTRAKYFLVGAEAGAGAAAEALDVADAAAAARAEPPPAAANAPSLPPLSPQAQAQLAAVPYPSAVSRHAASVVARRAAPTLLGAPRPAGDAHPLHPQLAQVVSSSFGALVLGDARRDVVLEAYLSHCPMCMCLAPRVRMLAQLAAAHFPHVRVAAMNVDDNDRPLEWMPGPAFPTIQLFNAEPVPARGRTAAAAAPPRYTKMRGPRCGCGDSGFGDVASAPPSAAEADAAAVPTHVAHVAAAGARTTLRGTPPCVPAVDFSHPTRAGKMAVPTVVELLCWVAARSSRPFDPARVAVAPAELLGSAQRFADMLSQPQPPTPSAPSSSSSASAPPQLPSPSLLDLAHDMDAEARLLEMAVFDLFYFEHMAAVFAKASGAAPDGAAGAGESAGAGHEGGDADGADEAGVGPLPAFDSDAHRAVLPPFRAKCVERLRRAATDAAGYGGAAEARDAMEACADLAETLGVRAGARAFSAEAEDARAVRAARRLARELQ